MVNPLVKEFLLATGLPESEITDEFTSLANKYDQNQVELDLEGLRELMAQYLQDVMLEILEKENSTGSGETILNFNQISLP